MIAGVVKRLRDHGHAVIVEGAEISVGDLIERQAARIAALEAELLATCQREAATHARHDAKIAGLEVQVAAADRLAELWGEFDKPLLQFGSFGEMRKAARNALAAYRAAKGE